MVLGIPSILRNPHIWDIMRHHSGSFSVCYACYAMQLRQMLTKTCISAVDRMFGGYFDIPSGKHTKSYWKWPIGDAPTKLVVMFHSYIRGYPLVDVYITMQNHHVNSKITYKWAILNSYIKLPESKFVHVKWLAMIFLLDFSTYHWQPKLPN
jgi:uncharacterized membrane protein required for colicin V production